MGDPYRNGNGQRPFLPATGYTVPQSEVPRPYVPRPEIDGASCPLCSQRFQFDDDVMELSRGRLRVSSKTERLITTDPSTGGPPIIVTVHTNCVIEYYLEYEDPESETFWNLVDERAEELVDQAVEERENQDVLNQRIEDPDA